MLMLPHDYEARLAALALRCDSTAVLVEILHGQLHRQLDELRDLQDMVARAGPTDIPDGQRAWDIGPAMLTGL